MSTPIPKNFFNRADRLFFKEVVIARAKEVLKNMENRQKQRFRVQKNFFEKSRKNREKCDQEREKSADRPPPTDTDRPTRPGKTVALQRLQNGNKITEW